MSTEAIVVTVLCAVLVVVAFLLGRRSSSTPGILDQQSAPSAAPVHDITPAELLAAMPIAAVVVDSADRVVSVNDAALQMGLVRDGRIVVRPLLNLSRVTRSDGSTDADLQLPALPRRPGVLTVRAYGVLLTGRVVGLILIDITEQHRVEAVRRDFVANVSHELKTPIGAITLLGEAIEDAADDQDAVRRFALSMQKESKRLTMLIAELIELSRLQGGEPAPPASMVRIADVVAEGVDRLSHAARAKNIDIVVDGDDALQVHAIGPQLVMAVSNLISNAVSYSPDGTTVAVTYRLDDSDAEIVVKDEGIGIAPHDLDRIFERFYRVDRARSRATGGTGLGLAIVKHIVTNHGGTINVWSGEGAGSTFSMRIPVTYGEHAPEPERPDHSTVSDTSLADPEPVR